MSRPAVSAYEVPIIVGLLLRRLGGSVTLHRHDLVSIDGTLERVDHPDGSITFRLLRETREAQEQTGPPPAQAEEPHP